MNTKFFVCLAAAVSVAFSAKADNDPTVLELKKDENVWEKGAVKFGGYITVFDSELEFGVNDAGITINAEDQLGLDSTLTVFRADALYRPGKSRRQQIDFSYASYNRHGRDTLTEEIIVDGEVIIGGTEVESNFDFDIIRATYSYAILQNDHARIALGLGAYVLPLSYSLEILTEGDDREIDDRDITLPLPLVALRADFRLWKRLYLTTELNAMYLEIDDFQGSIIEATAVLEYRIWKHFALGVGGSAMSVHVEGAGDGDSDYPNADFEGSVDVKYAGLLLYGKLTF